MTAMIPTHGPPERTRRAERLGSRTMRGAAHPVARTPLAPGRRARAARTPDPRRDDAGWLTAVAGLALFVLGMLTVELRTDVTAEGFRIRAARQEAAEVRHYRTTLETRLEQRLFADR